MTVCQALMVQAQAMQDGRLEIMDMHRALDDPESEFVRSAQDLPAADAAARRPRAEAIGVVISPGRLVHSLELSEWGTSEFTSPDHER